MQEFMKQGREKLEGCAHAEKAKNWISWAVGRSMEEVRNFSVLDFGIFKLCLLSLGLWLGTLWNKLLKHCRPLLFLGFAISWLYLIWRIFFKDED